MLSKLRVWLRKPTANYSLLSDVLSTRSGKEELLGVVAASLPTPTAVLNDIKHVLTYSQSADYQVWAQEAWSQILLDLDRLLEPKATAEEINFYRGALSRTLALLRVSHKARMQEPRLRKQADLSRR